MGGAATGGGLITLRGVVMKLIKLESISGKPVWVNPEWVVGLEQMPEGVQIFTGEGDNTSWMVSGESDEVAAILMGDHDD